MQQITDWLEKLGMSEYAQRFAENGIDLSVLPDLTDQDLGSSASCSAIAGSCCVRLANLPALLCPHLRPPQLLSLSRKTPPSAAKSP
jgi:hypothetical protein